MKASSPLIALWGICEGSTFSMSSGVLYSCNLVNESSHAV